MAASAFIEQVRTVIRLRHLSYRTEQTYCDRIMQYIRPATLPVPSPSSDQRH
jgi:hypothetical protein